MKNENQTKTSKKNKKALKLVIRYSNELYDEKESIERLTQLCMMMLELDRKYQSEKLEEAPQYCIYCKKQIIELNDLYTYDEQNCCLTCGGKILQDPNHKRTFCGFPVVENKKQIN